MNPSNHANAHDCAGNRMGGTDRNSSDDRHKEGDSARGLGRKNLRLAGVSLSRTESVHYSPAAGERAKTHGRMTTEHHLQRNVFRRIDIQVSRNQDGGNHAHRFCASAPP
jgi:hypothetical protein